MRFGFKKILAMLIPAAIAVIIALVLINRRYQTVFIDVPNFDHLNNAPSQPSPSRGGSENSAPPQFPATSTPASYSLPTALLLKVPFTPQAPTANWDELHNEACEEASAIMAAEYFAGNQNIQLVPEFVEGQITKLTVWEDNHFGYHLDINSEEVAQLLENFYGLQTKILTDYNQDIIKQELARNHLVLLPANGRLLGNPNYKRPGPLYHMLVIKGYNATQFITNDPGTRKGQSYPYSYNTLYKANGDFDHSTHLVDLNKKMIIVVWK